MNNDGLEILKTYKIIGGNKIAILSNGNGYLIAPNGQTTEWYQGFPYQVGALQFCIKDDGQLSFTGPYNNQYYQDFPVTPELSPSAMRFNGTLINFDNYNQLWPAMGQQLKNTYCILRSQDKIPVCAKNQFKKAFISMGKNKINLNLLLDPNTCQPFLSFFEFAKTILNNTNSVNDCNNLNTIFQFCCLPQEKTSLQNIYNQKNQQLKGNNQGFYQNNFNQLNNFNNQNYNNQEFKTKISNEFFGELQIEWQRNGSKAQIVGLTVNGSQINDQNQLKGLATQDGLCAMAKNNFIYIKFKNNNTLEIYDWNDQFNHLARINLLQQQVNQNQNVNNHQNFNANNNFNKGNFIQGAFIQNNNFNNLNFQFNQQNFQQQFTQSENNVLNNIQQFYTNMLSNKYLIICNCYSGNIQEVNEINNFYASHMDDFNALNSYYNEEYAKYWINKFTAQEWKQLVSKCNCSDYTISALRNFLRDAGCECFSYFLTEPLVKLSNQQKLNIIQATFNQNNLIPLPKYKKYFGDIRFLDFLAWYAQQQNLPDNPNAATLAGMFGNYNPSDLEQNRCNGLLNSPITLNDGNQSYQTNAVNDKILAYYIGYILFSNDQKTQDFGRLFALKEIFPWLQKYTYNNFGQPTFDWFPEAKPPLIGGVEICQPKPVDEDVKECLKRLSENGVDQLGNEYQVETKKGKTIIRKDSKLIFEGKLSADKKGFTDGKLVIKYDNRGEPDEHYEGQFKGIRMDGNGTYVFAKRFQGQKNHEAYEGQFKDGQMHGKGTYYTADGFSAEITYDNGLPINVKNAKDRSDTDVIVFDFFGFASGAYEDKEHGGRYNSSFFITDDRSYQYKREKIFKLKDEEGMPGLYQQPNEGQQKAMDFIKTHLLIQGVDYYTKLFNEEELRKIQGFDFDKAMREFGNGQLLQQLSQLTSQEAKEKWLCFVIDEIGPDAFNKLYLEDNMNYHFSNIQRNTDKKLKIVLNIHGTPQLGMSFGPKDQGYKEKFELINKVFKRAASLGRDMYVSNNSCYGSQFLDDKQNIFKQIGVGIFANKADFKPIITYSGINESIEEIKKKYGSVDKFLEKCKLKAEADSWRLTKNYKLLKNGKDLLKEYEVSSLKDFFVNTFGNVFLTDDGIRTNLFGGDIFNGCKQEDVHAIYLKKTLGSSGNIDFLQKIEKISSSDRLNQPFNEHIRDFFDFVKKKLFEGDSLDQLTKEGQKIDDAIEARNKIVRDLVEEEEIDVDNMSSTTGLENPGYKLIPYSELESNHKVKEVIKDGKEEVLKKIDQACEALKKTKKDEQQIESLKQEISEKFEKNGGLESYELIDMLSKVDLFYLDAGSLIQNLEDEFVKQKMEKKLKANNLTLEQLDKFGDTKVNEMLGHLSTSIWLTRSFLLGGVLSKEMGVDKILEGFREKCYRLLYKFGDQEINDAAMTELNLELNQELGKIKNEIESKCQRYCEDIGMNNWEGVVEPKLQELKNKILTTDNYYTQQLTSKQIKELKQQQFNFDKKNLVKFLRLLPGKIDASMKKAKDNIVNYCKDIKNNNKQNIKDLLKQLKNDKMQNKRIIYSTNMTGMTPSYMIEMTDGQAKKSNRNLGKMYYEVLNNQIEPLVADKQKYQKALRKFENKLANTEKNGLTDDTPGLEGIKFHDLYDIKQIQNDEIMKFVKEGKQNKNKLMGWIEEEKNYIYEKFPENTKIKEQHDNIYTNQQVVSNLQPEYAINGATKVPKNNTKNRNIGTYNPYGPHDAKNNNPTYNQYTQYSQLDNNPLG